MMSMSTRWGAINPKAGALVHAAALVVLACGGSSADDSGRGGGGQAGSVGEIAGAAGAGTTSAGGTNQGNASGGTGGTAGQTPITSGGTTGGPAPGVDCGVFTTTDTCKAAGCYAFTGTNWTRNQSAGGEGGAPDSCTIHPATFWTCRDNGSGGAVATFGCDEGCNECASGGPYLPKTFAGGLACAWNCIDGVAMPVAR